MDPLHATIEEFAADGYSHVQCYCPRCRMIKLRPISYLPRSEGHDLLERCGLRSRYAIQHQFGEVVKVYVVAGSRLSSVSEGQDQLA